jgi:hypothetical protein
MTREETFFLVWNSARMNESPKYRHGNKQSAKLEAERLARLSPGSRFYVLQAVSLARKVDVETVELAPPDIEDEPPF